MTILDILLISGKFGGLTMVLALLYLLKRELKRMLRENGVSEEKRCV